MSDRHRPQPDDFQDATRDFVRITAHEDGGRVVVEGSIAIPGLPTCRIRLRTQAGRDQISATREALLHYIRTALREDAQSELPRN